MGDDYPKRLGISRLYRFISENLGAALPLFNVNPNLISLIGFIFTIPAIIFINFYPLNVILIFVSLILDWLDGVYARRLNKVSYRGYMIDVTLDHLANILLSIALLNAYYGKVLLTLSIVNIALLYYSLKIKRHIMFPIRMIIFLILIFRI